MDRYVETNGIRVHLIDHEGDGPVLALAPGLTSNCHAFDALVDRGLAPAMRVLAFDLRGRGESDKPDSGYDLHHHASDIIDVLRTLVDIRNGNGTVDAGETDPRDWDTDDGGEPEKVTTTFSAGPSPGVGSPKAKRFPGFSSGQPRSSAHARIASVEV